MKIEEGKFYKTRDGRKVGPLERFSRDGWQTVSREGPDAGRLWADSGERWFACDRGGPTDFVAEWVDEPVVAKQATYLPEPGDTVLVTARVTGATTSHRGTHYNITLQPVGGKKVSLHFMAEDLIILPDEPATNDNTPPVVIDTAKAFDALVDSIFGLTRRAA